MATATQMAWLKTMVLPAKISQTRYGVPASITLAQCILESSWGTSQLARRYNNFFGVKAALGEPYCEFSTREVEAGRSSMELARFARYPSPIESFEAHARLIAMAPRYSACMANASDAHGFALHLGLCGYSTEPSYAYRLSQLIDQFSLTQYDTPRHPTPTPAQEAA